MPLGFGSHPEGCLIIANVSRWVDGVMRFQVPEGRKIRLSARLLSPLAGLGLFVMPQPSDKSLGYFRVSLRDRDLIRPLQILVALDRNVRAPFHFATASNWQPRKSPGPPVVALNHLDAH